MIHGYVCEGDRGLRVPAKVRIIGCSVLGLLLGLATTVDARITKIVITKTESPTFGGASFGAVGQFEKLVGIAYGEVDPKDPRNAIIQDIKLARPNSRGMVEYSTDVLIIKPVDMTKGNRMLFYYVVNRGNVSVPFNVGVIGGSNPTSAGDGFIQNMGYTLVESGWQGDLVPGDGRLTSQVPTARNQDGSAITGVVRSEYIVDAPAHTSTLSTGNRGTGFTKPYPTANIDHEAPFPDGFLPSLTVRSAEPDPRLPIPSDQWSFGSCPDGVHVTPSATDICLRGAGFEPKKIYELIYRAKDPLVLGLGYAAMRDLLSFLKHERHDDVGTPNPLWVEPNGSDRAGSALKAVFSGGSQSGRSIRTFIHLGFNEDERSRMVFDGAFPLIGSGRVYLNTRFASPGRLWMTVVDHLYPSFEFPFAYESVSDPLTGKTDGILQRCTRTNTCPKIFHFATASEVWEGRQSLGLTDPMGRVDLQESPLVRNYIHVSTTHGPGPWPPSFGGSFGDCQQQLNPNNYGVTQRALWVALTAWVKDGTEPPPSQSPRIRDGTLVVPSQVKFPKIPANKYNGVDRPAVKYVGSYNALHVRDYGPQFTSQDESGIITIDPPHEGSASYAVLVPQVDADGNDLGGIRSTTILAPTATYTGWNLFPTGVFGESFCSLSGTYVPFARTRAERMAVGDPRPSLQERYQTHEGYVAAVRLATEKLVHDRFLLPVDATRLVIEAEKSNVLRAEASDGRK